MATSDLRTVCCLLKLIENSTVRKEREDELHDCGHRIVRLHHNCVAVFQLLFFFYKMFQNKNVCFICTNSCALIENT